ncbi:hypothetical protein [Rickettsiales endosymbiont of Trichoplax sp. H2]|uniref:hypothetical protein n=1 Tax=Rickettsiales endosymbiont of Trichoplax sp. H2 TaxID=2021221 RepID=UPI0012B2944D|nr:hypothetical protein [Rickettsiales endosymbiont of Trichoplax sp. H2]MSO13572.1 hypothetical protein [Rickettsiales endosymbiont of Trichoplax sp. H2]
MRSIAIDNTPINYIYSINSNLTVNVGILYIMLYTTWKFVVDRIPNVQEMIPEIFIRSLMSNKLEDFYNDFVASSIFKDISKLPFAYIISKK